MPTKEEILKKHFSNNSGTPWSEIHAAMEEYAKQEALGALTFYKSRVFNHTISYKDLTETWDEFYEKYQKSKVSS